MGRNSFYGPGVVPSVSRIVKELPPLLFSRRGNVLGN